jgi:uncharacterized protein
MQAPKNFTNRLVRESSPYLQQHAHNPVDWYPWGDEAFERARAEDKPLLVSIGYSACHWCHVMEHESFEDEKVAAIMNQHFVNIKVDMEERPDVDQIYMNFVQITTGRGGWPMNVFITPDKLPFFGGTYFPPGPRYGMPSWGQILLSIAEAWRERRDELARSAQDILGELRRLSVTELSGGIDEALLNSAFNSFSKSFDPKNGGWGGAPKFPQAMSMEFLLRHWKRTGDAGALEMVRKTAEKMANGGIYDQLGGGFHRYAVDAVWLVPHFEKMLYDNAQLIRIYLHLYQIYRSNAGGGEAADTEAAELFRRIAVETLDYVRREMLDPAGGFYSSQDADSEGEEGKFFVWTPEEVIDVLGEEEARIFNTYYDVTPDGNFEGKSILNTEFGAKLPEAEGDGSDAAGQMDESRRKLFGAREKRVKPFRDEKVLTAWNGLMLAAFADAAAVLDSEEYLETARRSADFLLADLVVEDADGGLRVLRTWKDGRAKLNGYIEDHANLADGLIELYQVSGEVRYLQNAKRLAETMISEFWDEDGGGFFFTSHGHEELIVRNKDFFDNATPSGNSVAADVLLKLSKFYGDDRYRRFADTALRAAASQISRYPQGFGRALSAAEFSLAAVKEVAVLGPRGGELEKEVWADFRPFKVVAVSETEAEDPPLLEGRSGLESPAAYVCQDFVCLRPVSKAEDLRRSLDDHG